MEMAATLDQLPVELVARILHFLPPESALRSVRPLSRRFRDTVDQPLLWRLYCRASWRYWSAEHCIASKLAAPAACVDWKALWLLRRARDASAARSLAAIIRNGRFSIAHYAGIAGSLGNDAKDYLLAQCHVGDEVPDVLARRYYAGLVLGSVHRAQALDVWQSCRRSPKLPRTLERVLGAFDLFVLHDQPHDLDYITRTLDDIASRFQQDHVQLHKMSTREKALTLACWLRAQGLMGDAALQSAVRYRHLQNCLIGYALADPRHPSLPVISAAIFCCVAERLDLTAHCAMIPGHVHVIVRAPSGMTLDTRVVDGSRREDCPSDKATSCPPILQWPARVEMAEMMEKNDFMYLDPWKSEEEVDLIGLQSQLGSLGEWIPLRDFSRFQAGPLEVLRRVVANIEATIQATSMRSVHDVLSIHRSFLPAPSRLRVTHPDSRATTTSRLDLAAASYACEWVRVLLLRRPESDKLLYAYATAWTHDTWLVARHLGGAPKHTRCNEACLSIACVRNMYHMRLRRGCAPALKDLVRNIDDTGGPWREAAPGSLRCGQVVRHRRYGHIGFVAWQHNRGRALCESSAIQNRISGRSPRVQRAFLSSLAPAAVAVDEEEDEAEEDENEDGGGGGGGGSGPSSTESPRGIDAGASSPRAAGREAWYTCLLAIVSSLDTLVRPLDTGDEWAWRQRQRQLPPRNIVPRSSDIELIGVGAGAEAGAGAGAGAIARADGNNNNNDYNNSANVDDNNSSAWIQRFELPEEMLEPVTDSNLVLALPMLIDQAGQYFSRFDAATCRFV